MFLGRKELLFAVPPQGGMNLDKRLAQNLYADDETRAGAVGNESDSRLHGRAK
jgi:hypothetical protein